MSGSLASILDFRSLGVGSWELGVGSWELGISGGDRFFAPGGTLFIVGCEPAIGVYGDSIVNNGFELNDDDVLSMDTNKSFTKGQLAKTNQVKEGLIVNYLGEPRSQWVTVGMPCEILQIQGGGWQKGKIRLKFEFIPDEPPSPLDDLRS